LLEALEKLVHVRATPAEPGGSLAYLSDRAGRKRAPRLIWIKVLRDD